MFFLAAGYIFFTRPHTLSSLNPFSPEPPSSMSGFYEQEDPPHAHITRGRLQLRFLDDTHVDMLADNNKLGTATYEIQGNELIITHACGVWHMEIQEKRLYRKDNGAYFSLKEERK